NTYFGNCQWATSFAGRKRCWRGWKASKVKCPKCQAENREDAEFCGDCGIKLEIVCPKCGRSNPTSKSFCAKCRHSLTEAKAAPAIDYSEPQTYTPGWSSIKIGLMLSIPCSQKLKPFV
ncbi:MAG: zinc ribbon domain-containing protein, partial [Dehalococcoidia bacterium]|nr:zinc ribbon domain-containing protein [Dehalococcoidia bacterium]